MMRPILLATAIMLPAAAVAQTQPPPAQQSTSTTMQQTPTETQTTTTNSTTTAIPGTTETPAQTQTTTTKSTTTTPTDATGIPAGPSTTATTESTTTANSTVASGAATAADVKKGVLVFDQNGGSVGKIESVSGKNAVVDTGTLKASVPISSFAKNDKGLVIAMTKEQIDAAAKKASPKPKKG